MSLDTLLRDAYERDATFDAATVRTKVRRRHRSRRVVGAGLAVAVIALGAVGAIALTNDAPSHVVAGPPDAPLPGTIETDELVGSRWVLPSEGGGVLSWIEFDADGSWQGANDCEDESHGTWNVHGERVDLERDELQIFGCRTLLTLSGSATVTADGHLQFDADAEEPLPLIELQRLDALATPGRAELVDTWWLEDGPIVWGENLLDIGACEFAWNLVGNRVHAISPLCDLFSDSPLIAFTGAISGRAEVRLDEPVLYLSTTDAVIELVRPGPRDAATVDVVGRWSDGLTINADGTFRTNGCDGSSGIWTVDGREVHLRRLDRSNLMCLAALDRVTGPGRLRGEDLVFPSELPGDPHGPPVTFHRQD